MRLNEMEEGAMRLFMAGECNGHVHRVVLDVLKKFVLDEEDVEELSGLDHTRAVARVLETSESLRKIFWA